MKHGEIQTLDVFIPPVPAITEPERTVDPGKGSATLR